MSAIKTQQELLQMVGALQRAGYDQGYADAHPTNSYIQQEKTDAASRSAQKALSTAIEALQSSIAELTAENEALKRRNAEVMAECARETIRANSAYAMACADLRAAKEHPNSAQSARSHSENGDV